MKIHADNIIEVENYYALPVILRNLNTNSLNTSNAWSGPLTGYGFYSVDYETPLIEGHYYYR